MLLSSGTRKTGKTESCTNVSLSLREENNMKDNRKFRKVYDATEDTYHPFSGGTRAAEKAPALSGSWTDVPRP